MLSSFLFALLRVIYAILNRNIMEHRAYRSTHATLAARSPRKRALGYFAIRVCLATVATSMWHFAGAPYRRRGSAAILRHIHG